MFGSLFASLKADNNNEPANARRKYSRRDCDKCIVKINGQSYPIENWSLGGFLIVADARNFGMHDVLEASLKFKLSNRIIDIPHKAKVVRKGRNKIGFQFAPISSNVRGKMQSVVDDYVASQFANSQIAS